MEELGIVTSKDGESDKKLTLPRLFLSKKVCNNNFSPNTKSSGLDMKNCPAPGSDS